MNDRPLALFLEEPPTALFPSFGDDIASEPNNQSKCAVITQRWYTVEQKHNHNRTMLYSSF
jgi:hypothetical protein